MNVVTNPAEGGRVPFAFPDFAMPQFDASSPDAESVQCAVCDQTVKSGHWFARIRHGDWMVALCCPLCLEVFQSKPHAYIRRIETLQSRQPPERGG